MKSFEIRIYGDEVLRATSEAVKEFGSELGPFLEEMVETMTSAEAVVTDRELLHS